MKSILFLHNHSKLEVTYLLGSTPFPEIVTTGITHYSMFCTWSQPKPSFNLPLAYCEGVTTQPMSLAKEGSGFNLGPNLLKKILNCNLEGILPH